MFVARDDGQTMERASGSADIGAGVMGLRRTTGGRSGPARRRAVGQPVGIEQDSAEGDPGIAVVDVPRLGSGMTCGSPRRVGRHQPHGIDQGRSGRARERVGQAGALSGGVGKDQPTAGGNGPRSGGAPCGHPDRDALGIESVGRRPRARRKSNRPGGTVGRDDRPVRGQCRRTAGGKDWSNAVESAARMDHSRFPDAVASVSMASVVR
jgi:hypothetical protein